MKSALLAGVAAALLASGAAAEPSLELKGSLEQDNARAESDGTLTGSVAPALRPGRDTVATVRAIDLATVSAAATGRVRANGTYRVAVPPGVYLVLAEKVSARARPVHGFGRLVRVHSGRTARIAPIAPGSAAGRRALSGTETGARVGAKEPAVAVKAFSGSGPHAYLGHGLANMIVTGLVGSPCYAVIEWMRRAELLAEIRLQQSRHFDPSTRITPRLIPPTVFVEGSVATTASSVTWSIQARDIATGRIIASDRASAGSNLFDAVDAAARRLLQQLEAELCLPLRIAGSFSGRTGDASLDYSWSGTITYVRDDKMSTPIWAWYAVEKVAFSVTAIVNEVGCTGRSTGSASLGRQPLHSHLLLFRERVSRGHRYELHGAFLAPPSTIVITCPTIVFPPQPWQPTAQLITAPNAFYTDKKTFSGTNTIPGSASAPSYTWNLEGSS